jgi:flagellar hook-associated protein 1 FlgK
VSDLLSIGAQGVRAYQAALSVTGDNVANADTPGFSRRKAVLLAGPSGSGSILQRVPIAGSGVMVSSMERATDALKLNAARIATGDHTRFAARADWLTRVESSLANARLDANLAAFYDAGADLAAAPTAPAARALFLAAADEAAFSMRSLGNDLARLSADLETATAEQAGEVNSLTEALARTNEELRRTQASSAPSLSLLDTRDQLLAELSARIRITVTEGEKGAVTVRLGTTPAGATLVPEFGNPVRVAAKNGPSGAELILDPTHSATPVRLPLSGSLAGLIEATRTLAELRTNLDDLAARFTSETNAWHESGTDFEGNPGRPLFTSASLEASPGRANAGPAALDFTIADSATLSPSGYRLITDAGGYTLSRLDGTATISGTAPLSLDGVTVNPTQGARPGDSWTLSPLSGARATALRPLTPAQVAAAARYTTDASPLNTGTATLTAEPDPLAAAFIAPPPLTISITSPGSLDVIDPATGTVLATLPFIPGERLVGDGYAFTISGNAQPGDSFRLLATGPASANNANALSLANVRDRAGASGTIEQTLDAQSATLGTRLAETNRLEAAARAVRDDATRAADAVSGVDLDREAAELTRLQMAYRANAQVIQAARDIFDAILGASR